MNFTKKDFRLVIKIIRGRKLLDIGSAGQGNDQDSESWIFGKLERAASSTKGIDILPCEKENVVQASVENFSLNEKFSVVTMFDVIEHLDNVGIGLTNIKIHLEKEGLFILTTPNIMSIGAILDVLCFRGICGNPTHTLGYNKKMLKLILENNGFEVKRIKYLGYPLFGNHKGIRKLFSALRAVITYPLLFIWRDFSPTIMVIAKPK